MGQFSHNKTALLNLPAKLVAKLALVLWRPVSTFIKKFHLGICYPYVAGAAIAPIYLLCGIFTLPHLSSLVPKLPPFTK